MRYIILVIFFIISSMGTYLFVGDAYCADWRVIMKIDDETYYYDDESLDRTSGGIVSLWGRAQKEKGPQDNLKDLIEIDCNKREFRVAATVELDKDLDGTQRPQEWSKIENNSPSDKLFRLLCTESK